MIFVPDEYKKFINSVKKKCKYHGIQLVLSPSKQVILSDDYKNECSGYFSGSNKHLVVACGRPAKDWIDVLVHESSHMDQWIQRDPRVPVWEEACASMWDYLSGIKLLNKAQLRKVEDLIIENELDCEKRSVDKIRKWGLPIPIENYIREANTYVFSYRFMGTYKKFPTSLTTDRKLIEAAPKIFLKSYQQVPTQLGKELHRFFEELLEKEKIAA
jgi:hypothetical protein